MANTEHGDLMPGVASGIHVVHHWAVASEAARLALVVDPAEAGKVCRQKVGLEVSYWIVDDVIAGVAAWSRLDNDGGVTLSATPPPQIAAASSAGDAMTASPSNHTHAHGDQAGGTLHAVCTGSVAGFMSAADKAKLDGIAPGATVGPAAPSGAPPELADSAGVQGTVGTYAAATHTHAHGNRGGGSLHATVIAGGAAGFMSGADKTKLDNVGTGANTIGAASSTDNAVARFDGATGKTLQNCGVTIDDTNNIAGVAGLTASGALSGASCTVSGTLSGASLGGAVGSIPFVTIGNSGALAGERALTAGQGITITDGGANSTVTVAINFDPAAKADKEWNVIAHGAPSLSITNTHRNALIVANMAGSLPEQSVVIPNDATLNLAIGFTFTLLRDQNWRCSVDWLSGVYAVMDPDRVTYCNAIGSSITCTKIGANRWWITGDLAADVPDVP